MTDGRYWISLRVEVEHERQRYAARGAIDAESRAAIDPEALGLLRVILYRALSQLDNDA